MTKRRPALREALRLRVHLPLQCGDLLWADNDMGIIYREAEDVHVFGADALSCRPRRLSVVVEAKRFSAQTETTSNGLSNGQRGRRIWRQCNASLCAAGTFAPSHRSIPRSLPRTLCLLHIRSFLGLGCCTSVSSNTPRRTEITHLPRCTYDD